MDVKRSPTVLAAEAEFRKSKNARGKRASKTTLLAATYLEQLIRDSGGMGRREICMALFGEISAEKLNKTQGAILLLRKLLRLHGEYFYAVRGKHQIIDTENYLQMVSDNKDRVKAFAVRLREMIVNGMEKFPEHQGALTEFLGILEKRLLK